MFKVFKTSGIEGNYSISSYPLFVNNSCWSVYPAKHKTTKKQYSVWQFQKKEIEQRLTNEGVISKSNKHMIMNDIFENLRSFIGNQMKLKHPNFVTVIEPLEDHKSRVLFVTENVINDVENINKEELDEIMIAQGLLQVCTGLKFLHESVNSVHLNLNPSSILITDNYDWKISGLTFMEKIVSGAIEKYIDPIDNRLPTFLSIDFRFSSPNLMLKHKVDYIDDLFSLCCMVFYLYTSGNLLIKCEKCSSISDYERGVAKMNQLLQSANSTNNHASFQKIPKSFYHRLIEVLQNTQESNTDVIQLHKSYNIDDLMESEIFNNPLIKVLNTLDGYTTFSTHERINYLKGLKNEIEKFPKTLIINKFIPILIGSVDIAQFKKKEKPPTEIEELIVEVCDNLLIISKSLSQLTFTDKVFPYILSILKKTPFDGFKILLLKNLSVIQSGLNANSSSNSNNEMFQKFSLDLFEKCIGDTNSMVVQELTLTYIKTIMQFQQYSTITNNILPKLCTLYSTTTSLKVKSLSVNAFITMVSDLDTKVLDDHIIVETLLPLIYNTSPAIFSNTKFTQSIIRLYNSIFKKLSGSSTKKFNVKGADVDLYDVIMELGFNIWKLAKYMFNKQDLNNVYQLWSQIEQFMKKELDSKASNSIPESSPAFESTNFNSNIAAAAISPAAKEQKPVQGPNMTVAATNDYTTPKPGTSTNTFSTMATMKPKKIVLGNQNPKIASTPRLVFGQTNQTINSVASNTIDWTTAESGVMKPTTQNGKKNTTSTSFNVMPAMAPTRSSVNVHVNGAQPPAGDNNTIDDEWGAFEIGSTTKKNEWDDLLI